MVWHRSLGTVLGYEVHGRLLLVAEHRQPLPVLCLRRKLAQPMCAAQGASLGLPSGNLGGSVADRQWGVLS